MKRLFLLPLMLLPVLLLRAQESPGVPSVLLAYAGHLGMTIDQALGEFGPPDHMFSYQGDRDKEGSVVFYYEESFSLFWTDDRVWQLRMDDRFADPAQPVLIGQTLEGILEGWGTPAFREENLLIYDIPGQDYPIRSALYFGEEGSLVDLYLFRSDY